MPDTTPQDDSPETDLPAKAQAEKTTRPRDKSEPPALKTAPAATNKSTPFNSVIDIFYDQPLPIYDRGPIKAYKAAGKDKLSQNLIAYICERHIIPRWHSAANYNSIANPHIIRLIASGTAFWPPEKGERYIFIYAGSLGNPMLRPGDKLALGLKPDLILERVVKPLVDVLRDFKDKGFVHGNINIYNIYDGGHPTELKNIILGDALTAPHSYTQPLIYETIERSMADSNARGLSTFADDLYSLGVVLMVMLRHHDPLAKMTFHEIIHEKIESGTYAALTGKDRFTGAILELLRGILNDDRHQRWSIEDVNEWLDGRRLTPKQSVKRKKATRNFYIEGERYIRPELLSLDLPQHRNIIETIVQDGKLVQWIERSLSDDSAAERLQHAIDSAPENGPGDSYKDRLLSRVCIALDPSAPIHYKEINFHPEGFATAFGEAYALNKSPTSFAEIIQQNLIMFWLNSQTDNIVDSGSILNRFETCRTFLRNNHIGFGLERCFYFLNPEAPCMSDKLKNYFVRSPEDLMLAYEDMLEKGQKLNLFLDRHTVAFLSMRDSKVLDSYLIELNSTEAFKNVLGNVWTLNNIQKRGQMPPFPHIAAHIIDLMGPVLKRFHDRNLREKLKIEFDKIKKSGNLDKLTSILENAEMIETDLKAFKRAMLEYTQFEKERVALSEQMERKGDFGHGTGRSIAAIVAALIGGVVILVFAFLEISKIGGGGG